MKLACGVGGVEDHITRAIKFVEEVFVCTVLIGHLNVCCQKRSVFMHWGKAICRKTGMNEVSKQTTQG
jgi:hypothetical protein